MSIIDKKKCLLIYDQAPSHKNDEIIAYMNNNNLNYLFIPAGLTSKLQPLDISVNKVFKNSYKKKYTEYVVTQSENFFNGVKKPSRDDILNWIDEIWYGKNFVKKITIVNGFRKSGISLALDGSEDKEFSYDINDNECDLKEEIIDDNNED